MFIEWILLKVGNIAWIEKAIEMIAFRIAGDLPL